MKKLIALALMLAFGAGVQAKPTPVELLPSTATSDELMISTGPAAASLEQDYFRAPQPAYAGGRIFPCRLQLHIFDKTRLAQWCN